MSQSGGWLKSLRLMREKPVELYRDENNIVEIEEAKVSGQQSDMLYDSGVGYRIVSVDRAHGKRQGPVFRLADGGDFAIPTGRIVVRVMDNVDRSLVEERAKLAGFETVRDLGSGLILEPHDLTIDQALTQLEDVKNIPGIVSAEPQLLFKKQLRRSR